ncbi:MAG: SIMPL domain-containing protein [Sphaerochaetaceae bacterium]|jgi:uncharacterized protein YggE
MKHRPAVLLTFGLLAITVSVLTGCGSVPGAQAEDQILRTVSVSGTGVVKVTPDIATFTVGISESAPTTAEAQQMVNKKMTMILSLLRESGIEDKDMATNYLTLRPEYTWTDGKQQLVGQRASQQVAVTLRGLDKDSKKLSGLVDKLGVVTGIEFSSVQFDRQDKSQAYEEARELAVLKALEKAEIYSRTSGMTLARPLSISEQNDVSYSLRNNVATMPKLAMMESAGSSDYASELPSGDLEISCTIFMMYEMR